MSSVTSPLVWIVDDADSVRHSIAAVLETAGFTVRDFPSASAFLDAVPPGAKGYLILDHHMPGMTGLELLQHLGENVPPTIVITGRSDADLKNRLLQAGARQVFDKPVDGADLISIIQSFPVMGA